MSPEKLARMGRLLLGAEWQRPLARLLGPLHPDGPRDSIDPRLVQRWASADRPIPEWVEPVLLGMLKPRIAELRAQAEEAEALASSLRSP